MPIDPAAGFPLDPDAALRARIADLERQVAANPGAQAGGGIANDVVNVNGGATTELDIGPGVELVVPDPGAFVQLYAEAEAMIVSGASAARLFIVETVSSERTPEIQWPAAWTTWNLLRQPPTRPADLTSQNGFAAGVAGGALVTYYAAAGARNFRVYGRINGPGSVNFRYRRLFARVVQ